MLICMKEKNDMGHAGVAERNLPETEFRARTVNLEISSAGIIINERSRRAPVQKQGIEPWESLGSKMPVMESNDSMRGFSTMR